MCFHLCFGLLGFEYTFPLEGNGNQLLQLTEWNILDIPTLNTLSRWKGMETCLQNRFFLFRRLSLNTLSRLKGMETDTTLFTDKLYFHHLWRHFPGGREWKLIVIHHAPPFRASALETLSRWKGMETYKYGYNSSYLPLWRHFPGGREWKPLRTPTHPELNRSLSLETLSRWKGMETHTAL